MSDEQQPAVLDDITLANSTAEIQQKNLLCRLNHLSIIEVDGDDARQFLQGQLTNDVNALAEYTLQFNGYCDPKGRLIALFHLICLPDKYLMLIDHRIAENVLKRLQMYVLMAKVVFKTSALHCIGFAQQNTEKLPDLISNSGLKPCTVVTDDSGLILTRLDEKISRYLAIGDSKQLQQTWSALSKDTLACDESVWRLLDIRLGHPTLTEKTQAAFVPQMMNLDLVDGLSFNKGCYPGQEIVARMHHLGKLKRRMYRLHILCEEHPLPGDGIYSTETSSNENVGKIVSAININDNEFEALAVLQIKHREDNELYLDDGTDTKLTLLSIPYKIMAS